MSDNGKSGGNMNRPATFPVSARRVFLAHLAETSNVSAAARKAGVSTGVVYDLRRRSDVFQSQWHDALCEGFARVEALLLQEALKAPSAKTSHAMQRARDAKNRLRSQLLAHHRATVRGSSTKRSKQTQQDRQPLKAEIIARINQMRKNMEGNRVSNGV